MMLVINGVGITKTTTFMVPSDVDSTERPSFEDPSERVWNLLAMTPTMASQWDHDRLLE